MRLQVVQCQDVGHVLADGGSVTVRRCVFRVCCADARLQKLRWAQDKAHSQLPMHSQAAELLNRLLSPPPANPDQPLPTPTVALWNSKVVQLEVLLSAQHFFCNLDYSPHMYEIKAAFHSRPIGGESCTPFLIGSTDSSAIALRSLRRILLKLPYHMVGGHLPDMRLDVTGLMRCANQPVCIVTCERVSPGFT